MMNRRELMKRAIAAGIGIALTKSDFTQIPTRATGLKVLPPATGAYHAAFPDFGEGETNVTEQAIREFQSLTERNIAWAYFSGNWFVADENGKLKPRIKYPARISKRFGILILRTESFRLSV